MPIVIGSIPARPLRAAMTLVCAALLASAAMAQLPASPTAAVADPRADLLLVVDCLLPGQVRSLGQRSTYLSARRPARLPARDCQIRGGEYVAYDRADLKSALGAWLPLADEGNLEAQVIVGEIHERGFGVAPDHAAAAKWYRLAADGGSARAQVNLGYLYERGLGVAVDPRAALQWYRRAAGKEGVVELDAAVPPVAAAVPPAATAPPPLVADAAELEQLRARTLEMESALAQLRAELGAARSALESNQARQDEQLRALEQQGQATAEASAAAAAERDRLAQVVQRLEQREGELAAQRAESERLGRELTSTAALAAAQKDRIAALERPVTEALLAGPQLALVEPQLVQTRDIVPVALTQGTERQIVGRVTAPAGVVALTINDVPVVANELGVFTTRLPVTAGDSPVTIVAVDRQGKRSQVHFLLRGQSPELPPPLDAGGSGARALAASVDFGAYHALIIGNDDYQSLPDLASPVNDANDLARTLQRRYGFRTTVLLNANRYQILSALNKLRETMTERDNLLIYFAGHGELDEVNQRGHWLPVDAERDSTANWIPTTAITDILNIMRAKQVLLVVDSCYAGALTRSATARLGTGMTPAERLHWFRTMANKRSRTVLTSGGLAPVMDAGGGRHSVFAKALLEVLESNQEAIDGQRLHREVAARVAYAAANLRFDQVPEYAPIRFAGHEAGEFFLLPGN